MRKIIVSPELAMQLRRGDYFVCCDAEGNPLGHMLSSTAESAREKGHVDRIAVDGKLAEELRYGEFLTLCDAAGNVLGDFSPRKPNPELYWPLEPQISEEELARRRNEKGVYTTEEVLEMLAREGLGE